MGASAWVGIAALAVATVFNVLTLRRSGRTLTLAEQSYRRTEERYQADRLEANNDRLRDAIIDVSSGVQSFNLANAWFFKLLLDLRRGDVGAGVVQEQEVEKVRPALNEAYRVLKIARFIAEDEPPIIELLVAVEANLMSAMRCVMVDNFSWETIESAYREAEKLRMALSNNGLALVSAGEQAIEGRRRALAKSLANEKNEDAGPLNQIEE